MFFTHTSREPHMSNHLWLPRHSVSHPHKQRTMRIMFHLHKQGTMRSGFYPHKQETMRSRFHPHKQGSMMIMLHPHKQGTMRKVFHPHNQGTMRSMFHLHKQGTMRNVFHPNKVEPNWLNRSLFSYLFLSDEISLMRYLYWIAEVFISFVTKIPVKYLR